MRLANLMIACITLFFVCAAALVLILLIQNQPAVQSIPSPPQVITLQDTSKVNALTSQVQVLQAQLTTAQGSGDYYKNLYASCQIQLQQRAVVPTYSASYSTRDMHSYYDLTVRVRDQDSDSVYDAKVHISNHDSHTEYTDSDGKALFTSLLDGCYDITVSKSGYYTQRENLCLHEDRRISVTLDETN